jgi:Tol biopolymer transport system component
VGPHPTDAARRSALAAYPHGPRCVDTLHDVLHDKVHVTNNDTDDFNPDYSPDGNRIAYEGFEGSLIKEQNVEDASTNIYTIKVGGGGNLNLTKSPKNASKWNAEPRYSPDGEKIAYM